MCDETEWSEPLGGSGSREVRSLRKGTRKDRRKGVQGVKDAGIYLVTISISISTEQSVRGVCAMEVKK